MRLVVLTAALLAACDSLANGDYVGEPLFTLSGTFASAGRPPATPVGGIALLWQDPRGAGGPGLAVTAVPVAIEFPAAFRVSVPTPPPDVARFRFADDAVELGEAYVFVVADPGARAIAPRGSDRDHVLVFASADVAPGTLASDYLGGPVAAGYHLRRFTAVASLAPAQSDLVERCVAAGARRSACEVRRGYQLAAIDDADPFRIEVAP